MIETTAHLTSPPNKLQLSRRRPSDAVRAVLNAMQSGIDAAGQLNSMLGPFKIEIVTMVQFGPSAIVGA